MERPTSSVTDLQTYRYKPRDPPPPRSMASRDFTRDPPPLPRYESLDAGPVPRETSTGSRDPLKDNQQQNTRDSIGLVNNL